MTPDKTAPHQKKSTKLKTIGTLLVPPALHVFIPFIGIKPTAGIAGVLSEGVNGAHDASNMTSPLLQSNTLSYRAAVIWVTLATLAPAFMLTEATVAVAKTISNGLLLPNVLTADVMLAGVLTSSTWGLITWAMGKPSSTSHAILGGIAGAVMMQSYSLGNGVFSNFLFPEWNPNWNVTNLNVTNLKEIAKYFTTGWVGIISALVAGMPIAAGMGWLASRATPFIKNTISNSKFVKTITSTFNKIFPVRSFDNTADLQRAMAAKQTLIVSWPKAIKEVVCAFANPRKWSMLGVTAWLAYEHGKNDGQKGMPIVAAAFFGSAAAITTPVIWICMGSITLGTLMGGRKIAESLTHNTGREHSAKNGFIIAGITAGLVSIASKLGIPVSTSVITTAATIGTNAGHKKGNANWKQAGAMATILIITPVASATIGAAYIKTIGIAQSFNQVAQHEHNDHETNKTPALPVRRPQPIMQTQRHAYV
jgi:PiT family inorganic phosphate transporter